MAPRRKAIRAIVWASRVRRKSCALQTERNRRADRRSKTGGRVYAPGKSEFPPTPAISETGRARGPVVASRPSASPQPPPRIPQPPPGLPARDTSPPAAPSPPRNHRPAGAEASRSRGATTCTPAELRKVPRRQRLMRATHGGEKQSGQFWRIVFRWIVLVAKIAQCFAHDFTRIRVTARSHFSGNEFLQVLGQSNVHGACIPVLQVLQMAATAFMTVENYLIRQGHASGTPDPVTPSST